MLAGASVDVVMTGVGYVMTGASFLFSGLNLISSASGILSSFLPDLSSHNVNGESTQDSSSEGEIENDGLNTVDSGDHRRCRRFVDRRSIRLRWK